MQDGSNWYVYAGNNPLRIVDPTGLDSQTITYRDEQIYNYNDAFVGVIARYIIDLIELKTLSWIVSLYVDYFDTFSDWESPYIPEIEPDDKRVTMTTYEIQDNKDIIITSQTTYYLYSKDQTIILDPYEVRLEFVEEKDGMNYYRITEGPLEDEIISQEAVDYWMETSGEVDDT